MRDWTRIFVFTLLSATTAVHSVVVYTDISNYLLTGWWKDFEGYNCISDYLAATNPKPLDGTGQTCYINPIKQYQVMPGVFWFSRVPNITNESTAARYDNGIYSYYVMFQRFPNFTSLYPGPCDDAGVCECGNFEQVRAGWNETQEHPLDFCFRNSIQGEGQVLSCDIVRPVLADRQCNIYTTRNVTSPTLGSLGKFAVLMASLKTGTYMPTPSPVPGGGGGLTPSATSPSNNSTSVPAPASSPSGGGKSAAHALVAASKILSVVTFLGAFLVL